MFVLHGGFCEDRLILWAEPKTTKPALLSMVSELGGGLQLPPRAARQVVAWLPTYEGRIAPSGPVAGSEGVSDGDCYIAPHIVTGLPLEAEQAISVLAGCAGKHMAAPGVMIGEDLAYWVGAMRFAAGLTRRGQFLPSLVREEKDWVARWKQMAAGPDLARMEVLAKAMPPAARALKVEAVDQEPDPPAREVLAEFTSYLIDSLVRRSSQPRAGGMESSHDRWLTALTTANPIVTGSENELRALAKQIEDWQRPVLVASRTPFRLAFRLAEPAEDAGTGGDPQWQVQYLLQGTKDQSLLLAAADAWNPKKSAAKHLGTDAAALREHLLASLGQAAAVSELVEVSLRQPAPEGYTVDTVGAHRFLKETAGTLEQSGFGVMLPSWWTRPGAQARLQARASVKSASSKAGLTLDTLLEFEWQLALGGEPMTRAQLTALAKLKQPLVKVRGQWVEVDAKAIEAALEFLKRNPSGHATAREVVQMAIGAESKVGGLEVTGVTATGWVGEMLDRLQGSGAPVNLAQPDGLQGQLRPYQLRGLSWMTFLKSCGLGACLADDMGLGKTIQTLALLQQERAEGEQRPTLLVCPTSVVNNWAKEAARFTPQLAVMAHHGAGRKRGPSFEKEVARHALVISSYALLQRDLELLSQVQWAGVILDEAQNIKNAGTKQSRAARALKGGYRIALTGTPVENNTNDLWSLMEFLNPGFLGSESGFRKKFFVPIQVYSDKAAAERLRRITGPFLLRRLKTDKSIISDLPDKMEMKVFCNLTKEQASLYEAVVRDTQDAIESADGIERKGLVLALLMKLKQVCNHPAQFLKDNSAIEGRSGKLARITEMLDEVLALNERALIFTQFSEMGGIMQRHIQETFGIEVMYLHGGTPRKQRDQMVERFTEANGPRVFLLSLKAGGTGLNLTQANHVFHFDRWWNPAVENQATDRAFRIGQTKNVQVHKFVCAGTLEEKIDEMIEKKKEVAGQVVGTGEAWLSEFSNAQLRDLFTLRKEAVQE